MRKRRPNCSQSASLGSQLRQWYELPLGQTLRACEQQRLESILPDLFGYHLLQVGALADGVLSASRVLHRAVMAVGDEPRGEYRAGLCGDPARLPISGDSLDALVLYHTLDFAPDPHQVLREAERVLVAEGSIVVLGFNPWSSVGCVARSGPSSRHAVVRPFRGSDSVAGLAELAGLRNRFDRAVVSPATAATCGAARPAGLHGARARARWRICHGGAQESDDHDASETALASAPQSGVRVGRHRIAQCGAGTRGRSGPWLKFISSQTAPAAVTRARVVGVRCCVTTALRRLLKGAEADTTNNRMELTAAIVALESLTRACDVVLTTDSQYVRNGITQWLANWKRRNWKTAGRKPVKNIDLWQRLDAAASRHRVRWEWVRGHSGHPENELADQLANQAIDELMADT